MADGTADNFRALTQHADFVRAIARSLVLDQNQADDIEQQTWLAALQHPPRHDASPRGWLSRVVRNAARKSARSRKRRARHEGTALAAQQAEATIDLVARQAMIRHIADVVGDLDEPYRSVIIHRFYDGMPPRDIARHLGVPVETVRTRIKRALGRMRIELDRAYGNDRRAWSAAILPLTQMSRSDTTGEPSAPQENLSGRSTTARASTPSLRQAAKPPRTGSALAVALAALVIGLVTLWLAWRDTPALPSNVGTLSATRTGLDAATARTESNRHRGPDATLERTAAVDAQRGTQRSATEAERSVPRHSLDVHVTWADDGTPAEGIRAAMSRGRMFPLGHCLDRVTDSTGVFHVDGLAPGSYKIDLDRHRVAGPVVIDADGDSPDKIHVRIPRGLDVRGRVLDDDGLPIAGAEIRFCRRYFPDSGVTLATSDARGEFAIRSIAAPGFLGARAADRADSNLIEIPGHTIGEIEIALRLMDPGVRISGRVVDSTGKPVAGAHVTFGGTSREDRVDRRTIRPRPQRLFTGDDGAFRIEGVSPVDLQSGSLELRVDAPGFAPHVRRLPAGADIAARDHTVRLDDGITLVGNVRNADDRPAVGAQIAVTADSLLPGTPVIGTADEAGNFRIDRLPRTRVRIEIAGVNQSGRAWGTIALGDGAGTTADAATGATASTRRFDATLDRGIVLSGRLIDADDEPLAGWRIQATEPAPKRDACPSIGLVDIARRDAFSDASGRFEIANCADFGYSLDIFTPQQGRTRPCLTVRDVRPGEPATIRVPDRALPGSIVLGVLLDPSGGSADDNILALASLDGNWRTTRATPDETGAFELAAVPSGNYKLYRVDTNNYDTHNMLEFSLAPDERLDLGTIRLDPPGRVRVRLLAPDDLRIGRPDLHILDAWNSASGTIAFESRPAATTMIDAPPTARHTATADLLPPGEYTLVVCGGPAHLAATTHRFTTHADQTTEIEVEVSVGTHVLIQIIEPPANLWSTSAGVTIHDESGTLTYITRVGRNRDAIFMVDTCLPVGTHTVRVETDAGLSGSHRLEITETPDNQPSTSRQVSITLR